MQYNQPFDQPGTPNAPYVNGNPSSGIQGSIPPAAAFEYPQREIVNFITDSGLTPTNNDLHQLGEAVQTGKVHYGQDIGPASNTIIATLAPVPQQYYAGMTVRILLAHDLTGAATININGLGAKNVLLSGGQAMQGSIFVAGDIITATFDGTNFQAIPIKPASSGSGSSGVGIVYYIDTVQTFTCYGPGANFTGLDTAFEYLAKFFITPNGLVNLNCQAGVFTGAHSATVVLSHMNGDRIIISGAGLNSNLPWTPSAAASVFPNGQQLATEAPLLKSYFKTQIGFTGGVGAGLLIFAKNLTIQNIMFTGDGSTASSALNDSCGMTFWGGSAVVSNVAVHGFGHNGIGVQNGGGMSNTGNSAIVCSGNGLNGFVTDSASVILNGGANGLLIGVNNGQSSQGSGLYASDLSIIRTNGSAGGNIYAYNNATYGVAAGGGSFMSIGLSGSVQSCTPTLNTVGNNNATVVNTQ